MYVSMNVCTDSQARITACSSEGTERNANLTKTVQNLAGTRLRPQRRAVPFVSKAVLRLSPALAKPTCCDSHQKLLLPVFAKLTSYASRQQEAIELRRSTQTPQILFRRPRR